MNPTDKTFKKCDSFTLIQDLILIKFLDWFSRSLWDDRTCKGNIIYTFDKRLVTSLPLQTQNNVRISKWKWIHHGGKNKVFNRTPYEEKQDEGVGVFLDRLLLSGSCNHEDLRLQEGRESSSGLVTYLRTYTRVLEGGVRREWKVRRR